jgi:hypothetical protein
MCIKHLVLCAAIVLGTASSAAAAGPNGSAELAQCIANLQASGRSFGGDPDTTGMTAYDSMVGRCMDQGWRRRAR